MLFQWTVIYKTWIHISNITVDIFNLIFCPLNLQCFQINEVSRENEAKKAESSDPRLDLCLMIFFFLSAAAGLRKNSQFSLLFTACYKSEIFFVKLKYRVGENLELEKVAGDIIHQILFHMKQ